MNTPIVGRIERVALRDVWRHEALHLTTWLEQNLDLLGDTLGLNFQVIEREKRVGDFSIDLVAQDGEGQLVVIENQLERSDHDHLGKIITYVSMIDAKRAVWIVAEPRAEHLKAVQWLNENGTAKFHLLKLEAIKIGDSLPAPLFTVITGPSESSLAVGQIKRDQQIANTKWGAFWKGFVEEGLKVNPLFKSIQAKNGGEIYSTLGYPRGFYIKHTFNRNIARAEFYIDSNRGQIYTLALFHALERHKEEIEKVFGDTLKWLELPNQRVSRMSKVIDIPIDFEAPSTWKSCIEKMIEATIRLDRAFRPYLPEAVKQADEEVILNGDEIEDEQNISDHSQDANHLDLDQNGVVN